MFSVATAYECGGSVTRRNRSEKMTWDQPVKDAVPSLGTLDLLCRQHGATEGTWRCIPNDIPSGTPWSPLARFPTPGPHLLCQSLTSHWNDHTHRCSQIPPASHSPRQQSSSSHGGLTRDCQLGQAPFRGSVCGRGRDPLNSELGPGFFPQLPAHTGEHCCRIIPICNNTDGLGGHCAKRNKSDRERQMLYDTTYMWNQKIKLVNITKQTNTDIEN